VKKIKVALCIPAHRQVEAKWAQCLANMIAFSAQAIIEHDGEPASIDFETIVVSSSLLPESRNRLVVEAINWEADYMLWMDADHVFPIDSLLKLMGRSKLVVGCNYARRFTPTSPTASDLNDKLVWTTKAKAEAGEIEEVANMGLGLCLIDMRVYAMLERKAEEEGKDHFWPLFTIPSRPDGIGCIGEDVSYFQKLRDAGVKIFLDHELSWEVGHVHEMLLTNAHCEVQRDRYNAWTKTKMNKFKEAAQ
jgi:hypothetical protein